jgi:N-methylhydantoinase A
MTRLINMDNGGTLTDFCLIDGEEVRYTKTLTTPYGLSRCLLDGLAKVSELAYGEPQLATRAVHRLHPVFHHPGHRRGGAEPRAARAGQRPVRMRGPAPGHRSERGRRGPGEGITAAAIPVICSARSRCCSSGNWSPAPDDIRRTWPGLLNAFLHPAMQRFLFNAGRRLRDAPARQPSRIFRRRLTARSPRPARPDPKP